MDTTSPQLALRRTLEQRGIRDLQVLDAIERTPRERFIEGVDLETAYADTALSIGHEQTISQPYIVALMTELLELSGNERILEIGTGSGYQAAVLSQLCREVVTVERIRELSDDARHVLDELDCRNIVYRIGDGTLGCPEFAPYDGILVTAAAPRIPGPLYDQLAATGRLMIPVGDENEQTLLRVSRGKAGPETEPICGCRFVKLIGAAGWPPEESKSPSRSA
jgi:protein-L-isoaspartate(D-aspartate) O-methyltransferase